MGSPNILEPMTSSVIYEITEYSRTTLEDFAIQGFAQIFLGRNKWACIIMFSLLCGTL